MNISFPWDEGLPIKMLIEGKKIVKMAKIIPRDVTDKLLILKGSSSSLSKSVWRELREDSSLDLLLIKCLDFV